jgi:hypothetical protein
VFTYTVTAYDQKWLFEEKTGILASQSANFSPVISPKPRERKARLGVKSHAKLMPRLVGFSEEAQQKPSPPITTSPRS